MPVRPVDLPSAVRAKATAQGAEGTRWLRDLDALVDDISAEWGVRVGAVLTGGSGAFVATAWTEAGAPAVLKLAIPDGLDGHGPFESELATLLLGDGGAYVRVLRHDVGRRALLFERLGRSLATLGLPVRAQLEVIARTLALGWLPVPDAPLPTGAEKARWLARFIEETWEETSRPCRPRTVERALAFAGARERAFDPRSAVLVHGDAHPGNVLEAGPGGKRFKLIDPDGVVSEPAYDLAIPLREWNAELLEAGVGLAVDWCAWTSRLTGVAAPAIWQWAFVERVSTGLFLLRLGQAGPAAEYLAVADALADVGP